MEAIGIVMALIGVTYGILSLEKKLENVIKELKKSNKLKEKELKAKYPDIDK